MVKLLEVKAMAIEVRGVGGCNSLLDKSFLHNSLNLIGRFESYHKVQGKQLCISQNPVARARWQDDVCKTRRCLPIIFSLFTFPEGPAKAVTKEDIVTTLTKVEDGYQVVKSVSASVYETSRALFEQFLKLSKPAVDAAIPSIEKATDAALQIAKPVVSDVIQQAEKSLQAAGVDTKQAVEAAKTAAVVAGEAAKQTTAAIEIAKPIASATVDSLLSSDPIILVGGAGALILVYALAPSIFSSVAFSVRGYKGDLNPAEALNLLTTKDYVMIDIRTEKEKYKSGVPYLPSNARNKLLSLQVEELPNKLKGLVRKSRNVEAELTALKISHLKRLNKGSRIVIMDSYGDMAKLVARTLTALGFKNTWALADGFSGGKGWVKSCLGAESYNATFAEVLYPSRVIPAGFGTTSSEATSRRLLPSGVDD